MRSRSRAGPAGAVIEGARMWTRAQAWCRSRKERALDDAAAHRRDFTAQWNTRSLLGRDEAARARIAVAEVAVADRGADQAGPRLGGGQPGEVVHQAAMRPDVVAHRVRRRWLLPVAHVLEAQHVAQLVRHDVADQRQIHRVAVAELGGEDEAGLGRRIEARRIRFAERAVAEGPEVVDVQHARLRVGVEDRGVFAGIGIHLRRPRPGRRRSR